MMSDATIQASLQHLVTLLARDDLPDAVARTIIPPYTADIPSAQWSLGNRLLMLTHGTEDARGYRQWATVDRHPRRGARAFAIWAPRFGPPNPEDPEAPRPLIGFMAVPVFRFEDTDGAPLHDLDYAPTTVPPLYDVAEALGVNVQYAPFRGRAYGWFHPEARTITLTSPDAAVFFHELAHAVHHEIAPLAPGQVPTQEIVAELSAAVLASLYGYPTHLGTQLRYIRAYADEAAPQDALRVILGTLAQVDAVIRRIFALATATPVPVGAALTGGVR